MEAASIELVTGNGQTAEALDVLPSQLVVLVRDQNGDAFSGTELRFDVAEGSVSSTPAITQRFGELISEMDNPSFSKGVNSFSVRVTASIPP